MALITINNDNVPLDEIIYHYYKNKEQSNDNNNCKAILKVPYTRFLGSRFDENLSLYYNVDMCLKSKQKYSTI